VLSLLVCRAGRLPVPQYGTVIDRPAPVSCFTSPDAAYKRHMGLLLMLWTNIHQDRCICA
jgi:hypothetical protein